ncbi:MAG: response regulator, partial [Chitinivibrionales bacterium]|nr:response regulator [Chitinivibrionales bacterium]
MAYTIMVVDDSETIRAMLVRSLGMTGLPVETVVEAANGKMALQLLESRWVDIVLTDIHMPQMDGVSLVSAMQANPELSDIPVVIVSTEGSATRIEELKAKG